MALSEPTYDVIVLGAGAAGMMCAFEAGRRLQRVLLLDNGEKPGRKILISGGGRCNFTNTGARAENFLSSNPHYAKSALARYTPADFIMLVKKHGIKFHEKTLGQLFCDDSARLIVAMLERECAEAGVTTRCGVSVSAVRRNAAGFSVETNASSLDAASVVIATGGLSIPKLGATGIGYEIARSSGHKVVDPRAALVPLLFSPADREQWCDLTGLSAEVVATAVEKTKGTKREGKNTQPTFREKLLITHRGVSGPAVLQVSSYWRPGQAVGFDLAPGKEVLATMYERNARRDSGALLALLRGLFPSRFAERWVSAQLAGGEDWSNSGLAQLEAALHAWTFYPAGTEGFAKAEVTAGGVDTNELNAKTMESRRVPGLYFIGEVVDVTGWLGGYNFQWAWASAVAAADALVSK